jgi:hypothetical protein
MRRNRTPILLTTACLLGLPVAIGCESYGGTRVSGEEMGFWIDASDTDIVEGELVTLTAHDRNTVGRNAKVEWTTTAGDVNTEANGRIARVTFDKPGTYTVTGRLLVDGEAVREDSVDIEVEQIS